MNANLAAKAQIKNPTAYANAAHRIEQMRLAGTARDMLVAQADVWNRMILSGIYEIVR